jgi:hypothetical protein
MPKVPARIVALLEILQHRRLGGFKEGHNAPHALIQSACAFIFRYGIIAASIYR